MIFKKILLVLGLIFFFGSGCLSNLLAKKAFYDEVFDEDGVREPYKNLISIYKNLSEKQKIKIAEKFLKDFSGDNNLLPIPRVLSENESEILIKAVDQRAKALFLFLRDHYSGEKKYLKDNVIPREIIERIIHRSGEALWENYLKVDQINFWYGPDILRAPDGRFYFVEDNPGFIGGMGDLIKAKESLFKWIPEYSKIFDSPDPILFYKTISESYKKRAHKNGGIAVLVQYDKSLSYDNEDVRIEEIFGVHGIDNVRFDPYEPHKFIAQKRLVVDPENVWLETNLKDGKIKREKVGFLVLNIEPIDIDPLHNGALNQLYTSILRNILNKPRLSKIKKEEIRKLLKPHFSDKGIDIVKASLFLIRNPQFDTSELHEIGLEGLFNHFSKEKIGLSTTPGIDFIGDKEFYIYVDSLIRYYLKEEPIVKNIETGSFSLVSSSGEKNINKEMIKKIFGNIENYVIKSVDGRGGDQVWIGPKLNIEGKNKLLKMIYQNPESFIYQKYIPLSELDSHIVDLRFLTDVSSHGNKVSPVPWGRALSEKGNGKVNISGNGTETTVLIDRKSRCREIMAALGF